MICLMERLFKCCQGKLKGHLVCWLPENVSCQDCKALADELAAAFVKAPFGGHLQGER